ncbi:MAG TPA: pitrilysin family protein [Spirochaetota bacterium]|nr:pitrilysin family protein [Spirochaetota bacterium]
MRKTAIIAAITALTILGAMPPSAAENSSPLTPGLDFILPDVATFKTQNKLTVYYIKDELPMITVTAAVGFGKLYEKKHNAGISSLLAKTLSLSGSKKYPGGKLHEKIEFIGGRIGITSSWEQTYISLTVLERHAETAMDILGSILTEPNLDTRYIENARALIIEGIKRKMDQPQLMAFDKIREIIFNGDGYGATETIDTVKSISSRDLENVVSGYFTAANTALGISAPFGIETAKSLITSRLGAMQQGSLQAYSVNSTILRKRIREQGNNIYFLPKDVPQATIAMGTLAPSLHDEGFFPLMVMNYILGEGSFNSRLMQEIRVKRGLSYSTGSVMRSRKETGLFLAYAQTKTELADTTFSIMVDNIRKMEKEPVTAEELSWTNESLKNSYVFEFNTTGNMLGKFMYLHYNGLEKNSLNTYLEKISRVTPESIISYSNVLLKDGLIKVVVGKKEMAEKLRQFGNVVILE